MSLIRQVWSGMGLQAHGWVLLTVLALMAWMPPVGGTTVYLNRRCQRVSNSQDAWRVDFRRNLSAGGKRYWFSLARYQDGSAILCLSQPNYIQGRPLAVPTLQNQFIREIKQEQPETSFLITTADGNGRNVRLTQFRLKLTNPTQPALSKVKEWRN